MLVIKWIASGLLAILFFATSAIGQPGEASSTDFNKVLVVPPKIPGLAPNLESFVPLQELSDRAFNLAVRHLREELAGYSSMVAPNIELVSNTAEFYVNLSERGQDYILELSSRHEARLVICGDSRFDAHSGMFDIEFTIFVKNNKFYPYSLTMHQVALKPEEDASLLSGMYLQLMFESLNKARPVTTSYFEGGLSSWQADGSIQ